MDQEQKEIQAANLLMEMAEGIYLCPIWHDRQLFWNSHPEERPKPGSFFMGLPDDKKELLSHLRSDDLAKVRWPLWR